MRRGLQVLVVVAILGGLVSLGAGVAVWAEAHWNSLQPVLGAVLLLLGAACMTLHRILSDDYLRRHLGEPGADQMRRFVRGGWIPVMIGAALLGLHYVDRRIAAATAEAQSIAAFNRGIAAAQDRDWPAAAEAFSEAIRLDPTSAAAYRNRATANLHLGEPDRAIADLDEALRLAPGDAPATFNRGLAHARMGNYDRALADFSEAIRLNPDYARAYLARGRVHARMGNDVQAEADWKRAVELDPTLEKKVGWEL